MKEKNIVAEHQLIIKKAFFIIVIFLFFYLPSSSIITLIDNSTLDYYNLTRKYSFSLGLGLALILTFLFIYPFYKRLDFLAFSRDWLIIISISFLLSGMLAILIGSGSYWYLKYLIGILVGIFSYLFDRTRKDSYVGLLSGIVSVLATLVGGKIEYFLTMEPPVNPSILYINSFSNPIIWVALLLIIFYTAYFFSKGFLIKFF